MKIKWLDALLLALFPFVYLLTIVRYFWAWPEPSTKLSYLRSVVWGQGSVPFDQINLSSALKIFYHLVPGPVYKTSPIFAVIVAVATLVIGQVWLYKRVGFLASLALGVFVNCGWYFFSFGSQISPAPILTLCVLLSFVWFEKRPWLSGLFTSYAAFTHISGLILPFILGLGLRYVVGLLSGAVISLATFCICFGFSSLVLPQWATQEGLNNLVPYYDVLVSREFLPIFLSLLVCAGAYKFEQSRRAARMAWGFVVPVLFTSLFRRGGVPDLSLFYPAYFFACLSCAAYLGSLLKLDTLTQKLAQACLVLGALIIGLRYGIQFHPSDIFVPAYYAGLSALTRLVFNLGVILLCLSLLIIEVRKSRPMITAFLALCGFWAAAYAGGDARFDFTTRFMPQAEYYYGFAGALGKPSSKSVDVYVARWNAGSAPEVLVDLYEALFDQKFERTIEHRSHVASSLRLIKNAEDLKTSSGAQILTDQPVQVSELLPDAHVTERFEWNGLTLTVLERSR